MIDQRLGYIITSNIFLSEEQQLLLNEIKDECGKREDFFSEMNCIKKEMSNFFKIKKDFNYNDNKFYIIIEKLND